MAKKRRVQNKIAEVRTAAGLTRRALGAKLATSPEQIERWENGLEVAPGIASLLVDALSTPGDVLFPALAAGVPPTEGDWRRLGFDLDAPLPTWTIDIELRGATDGFTYLVDRLDAERVSKILNGVCEFDFIAFSACGRSIYVSIQHLQHARIGWESATLLPGAKYDVGALRPSFSHAIIYQAGKSEPLRIDAFQMDEDDLEAFSRLELDVECDREFLAVEDEDGDLNCLRVADITLAEIPNKDLLEEMDQLDDEFWDEP